jgi:hypothetical protein
LNFDVFRTVSWIFTSCLLCLLCLILGLCLFTALRSLKPAGDGGRRARLDFLHARIESAGARSEAARAPDGNEGNSNGGRVDPQNNYWHQMQLQKREQLLANARGIMANSARADGPGAGQGPAAANTTMGTAGAAPGGGVGVGGAGAAGGISTQAYLLGGRRPSAIPPLRLKALLDGGGGGGGGGGGADSGGGGSPLSRTSSAVRHGAALDAHARTESQAHHDHRMPVNQVLADQLQSQAPTHGLQQQQQQQQQQFQYQPAALPPLIARLPASYAKFLRPARDIVAGDDDAMVGPGLGGEGGTIAGGSAGDASGAATGSDRGSPRNINNSNNSNNNNSNASRAGDGSSGQLHQLHSIMVHGPSITVSSTSSAGSGGSSSPVLHAQSLQPSPQAPASLFATASAPGDDARRGRRGSFYAAQRQKRASISAFDTDGASVRSSFSSDESADGDAEPKSTSAARGSRLY